MNIKTERIEHIVQLVNRNLQLISAGHGSETLTPLEPRRLQAADVIIFAQDKFAYEMLHFVTSHASKPRPGSFAAKHASRPSLGDRYRQNVNNANFLQSAETVGVFAAPGSIDATKQQLQRAEMELSLPQPPTVFERWEMQFVAGLEVLLVECAVVGDEIERDCFISRVYCWFTDKLSERREIPRQIEWNVPELKQDLVGLGVPVQHAIRGLDTMEKSSGRDIHDPSEDHRAEFLRWSESREGEIPPKDITNDLPQARTASGFPLPSGRRTLPQLLAEELQNSSGAAVPPVDRNLARFGTHKIPVYVKNAMPQVLDNPHRSMLPQIAGVPTQQEQYGLLYNTPTTEAEKKMNDLWLARRKQEAFDFKTQQQLAVAMDRLAVQKSRIESDAVRKQESEMMLRQQQKSRPLSATGVTMSPTGSPRRRNRPMSASNRTASLRGLVARFGASGTGDTTHRSESPERYCMEADEEDVALDPTSTRRVVLRTGPGSSKRDGEIQLSVTGMKDGQEVLQSSSRISQAQRAVVAKNKDSFAPMRFRSSALPPQGKTRFHTDHYMQLSDSDEEDDPDVLFHQRGTRRATQSAPGTRPGLAATAPLPSTTSVPGPPKKPKAKSRGATARTEVLFKRDVPEIRERPQSARLLKSMTQDDAEFKVLYRHTNYRRQPITPEQQEWLEKKEAQRALESLNYARALVEKVKVKQDKGKKDKGGKGGKTDGKSKNRPGTAKNQTPVAQPGGGGYDGTLTCRYTSAAQFMAEHFPNFEDDDDFEAMAPMRAAQLAEVQEILSTFDNAHIPLRESVLRKALVVPQDKSEAITLEGLREEGEGLMVNPLPVELWRKYPKGKKGKKKGKKKK